LNSGFRSDVKRGDPGMDMSIGATRLDLCRKIRKGRARHRHRRPVAGDRCRNICWSNAAEKANNFNSTHFFDSLVDGRWHLKNIFAVYFSELPISLIIEWE